MEPKTHISSASHVIKMVQVKPIIDMKENRRLALSDPNSSRGPRPEPTARMGFFPRRAKACASRSASEGTSVSVVCGDFSVALPMIDSKVSGEMGNDGARAEVFGAAQDWVGKGESWRVEVQKLRIALWRSFEGCCTMAGLSIAGR